MQIYQLIFAKQKENRQFKNFFERKGSGELCHLREMRRLTLITISKRLYINQLLKGYHKVY